MAPAQFSLLLEKFLAEEMSSGELSSFLSAAKDPANHKLLYDAIAEKFEADAYGGLSANRDIDKMFEKVLAKAGSESAKDTVVVELPAKKSFFTFSRIAAASVILIILAGSLYLFFPGKKEIAPTVQSTEERFKNDVAPGHRGAVLTLSDGRQIVLDSIGDGLIAREGNSDIMKDGNGLAYRKGNGAEVVYHTVTTPNGRQYSLVLSDGSKVWLNAASSITYPTVFTGGERKVSISGEAFFEVAHHNESRFIVENGNTRVLVLGTRFNANAYPDEGAVKISLLEGSVNVVNNEGSVVIKPGQQVQVMPDRRPEAVNNVDMEQVVAWKSERFLFESVNIRTIMRQVARWYNVEVDYQADIPYLFVADMSMNLPVSELLRLLEMTGGVRFKIEGNTITVMK